ncbi:MAG: 30S ribosomal protein S19 [Candidatus Pacebacteria bacterium]|nr:30S ribosomal protein S19 [Candidatus Paceibacterota bacterium]
MPRSLKKGPYVDQKLLKKIKKIKPDDKVIIKTWARDCTIVPEMVGYTFGVHNGKNFISVKVTEEMVGHKLGELAPTTKFVRHGGKMQRELEAKAKERQKGASE